MILDRLSVSSGRYLSLATAAAGRSTPILPSGTPAAGALLATPIVARVGPAATAALLSFLPVRTSGIDVCETLYRLDAEPRTDAGAAIASATRLGEPLGTLTMRWLAAPDGFEATPSALPPDTELDPSRSQRFVLPDGAFRFDDRSASGARFFGAGRTFPVTVEGAARLLFAGAAVVVEGLGNFRGLRGTLTILGEISSRSLVSLTLAARFDDDGPFEASPRVAPIGDGPVGRLDATILTMAGVAAAGGAASGEVLLPARIESELSSGGRPRTRLATGEAVGRASGTLRVDALDRRWAVPLADARRTLQFVTAGGEPSAALTVDAIEGTAFGDRHSGEHVTRVVGYGPLSAVEGALAGTAGVAAFDAAVGADGASATMYTVWLVDPEGRFRAAAPAAVASPAPRRVAGSRPMQFEAAPAIAIHADDLAVLAHVERSLAAGADLAAWLGSKQGAGDYTERFDVAGDPGTVERFGFLDTARVADQAAPAIGIIEEMFYDRDSPVRLDAVRPQLEAFVLRHFLRVAGGFSQVYYKHAGGGPIGRFDDAASRAIVDLRDLESTYEWVVLKADPIAVDVGFAPFGSGATRLEVPVRTGAHVVIAPAFVTRGENPGRGVAAEYGYGYAFVAGTGERGLLATVPEEDGAAVQTVTFKLLATGEIRVRSALAATRTERLGAVDIDPIGWGVQAADALTSSLASRLLAPLLAMTGLVPLRASGLDPVAASIRAANAMTGGLAGKRLGISKAMLERRMLLQHFARHQDRLHRSLQRWRMAPDWTADGDRREPEQRGAAC
jgi:hypothetical protein